MVLRLEHISAIIIAVLLGWGWQQATDPGPICQVQETVKGKTVLVPVVCSKLFIDEGGGRLTGRR